MGDWLRHLTLSAQARTGFGSQLIAWFLIALVSLGLGLVFLCVAAFVWLAQRYDGVTAGLVLAGFFLIVAILATLAGLLARRRNRERARLELAARNAAASWFDPKLLAVGLQIGRTIGWRRIIMLAAAGLVAAGVAKEWAGEKEPKDDAD
jgi:hypothetical protein